MLVELWALVCFQSVMADAEGGILPTFVFPDEDDRYFGENVEALKTSLDAALDRGCMNSWHLAEPTEVAILFRHDSIVPETSTFFIQYQMEQVAASPAEEAAVGFRSFADHSLYKKKLNRALQVWEWSPRHLNFLGSNLLETAAKRLQYVPLWSAVDVDSGVTCIQMLERPSCQSATHTDVLFFGAPSKARKTLCKAVDAEMDHLKLGGMPFSHDCLFDTFGEDLRCKICKAKVIYSDHSRKGAMLEQHRINPLLALGKAVVTATSSDEILDSTYSGAVKLSSSEGIPRLISHLLLNETARFKLEWSANAFARKMKLESHTQVCSALKSLAGMSDNNTLLAARTWSQEQVIDDADRRLATNASNASITPRPVCTSLPTAQAANIDARYDVASVVQEFSQFRSIANLQVWQSNLGVLTGLDFVECTEGNVSLRDNSDLSLLSGLNRLSSIAGSMEIENNSKLTSLVGINGLSFVGGDLKIHGNPKLESAGMIGLMGLRFVGGRVEFTENPHLNCEEVYRMCGRLEKPPKGGCVCLSQSEKSTGAVHIHNTSIVFTGAVASGTVATLDIVSGAVSNALADMANIDYRAVTITGARASGRRLRGTRILEALFEAGVIDFQIELTDRQEASSRASLSAFAASSDLTKQFIDDHAKLLELGTELGDSVGVSLLPLDAAGPANATNSTSNEGLQNEEQANTTIDKINTNGTVGERYRDNEETTTTSNMRLWNGGAYESSAVRKNVFFELVCMLLAASVSWY